MINDRAVEEGGREEYNLQRADEIEQSGRFFVVEYDGEGCPVPESLATEWQELERQVAAGRISRAEAFYQLLRRANYQI